MGTGHHLLSERKKAPAKKTGAFANVCPMGGLYKKSEADCLYLAILGRDTQWAGFRTYGYDGAGKRIEITVFSDVKFEGDRIRILGRQKRGNLRFPLD